MGAAHVPVHQSEEGELGKRVDNRTAEAASDIDDDGPQVEGEQVGVLHQRQGAPTEIITQRLRHVLGIGPTAFHLVEEALELRRALLLTVTVVRIVKIEQACKPAATGQTLIDGTLRGIAVELAALLT